jgi:hypothetical protein
MINHERRAETDRRIAERYLTARSDLDAFKNDAQFHAEVQRLRRLLGATDKAMDAEGVDEPTRDRVMYRLLYGIEPESSYAPPDFRDARNRLEDRQATIMREMRLPLPEEWKP